VGFANAVLAAKQDATARETSLGRNSMGPRFLAMVFLSGKIYFFASKKRATLVRCFII